MHWASVIVDWLTAPGFWNWVLTILVLVGTYAVMSVAMLQLGMLAH